MRKNSQTLEFKWEEDEEYKVKTAVVTSIACIRARDGQSPQVALDFLLKVLKTRSGERCAAPGVPQGCPNSFKLLGDKLAQDMDLSNYVSENYLACCYVNINKTEVLPGIRHPVLGLMEECHGRLELELFLQLKREEGGGGGGWDTTEAPVATSCITAPCTLALLKGSPEAEGGGSMDEEVENLLKVEAGEKGLGEEEDEEGEKPMNQSELALSANFYASIFANFEDIGVKAAAAQVRGEEGWSEGRLEGWSEVTAKGPHDI